MNEQCIVIRSDLLMPKYTAEDDIPRDGGKWPEYANTSVYAAMLGSMTPLAEAVEYSN